jgi:hypothetical protein
MRFIFKKSHECSASVSSVVVIGYLIRSGGTGGMLRKPAVVVQRLIGVID